MKAIQKVGTIFALWHRKSLSSIHQRFHSTLVDRPSLRALLLPKFLLEVAQRTIETVVARDMDIATDDRVAGWTSKVIGCVTSPLLGHRGATVQIETSWVLLE
jgi:hypothetical protein